MFIVSGNFFYMVRNGKRRLTKYLQRYFYNSTQSYRATNNPTISYVFMFTVLWLVSYILSSVNQVYGLNFSVLSWVPIFLTISYIENYVQVCKKFIRKLQVVQWLVSNLYLCSMPSVLLTTPFDLSQVFGFILNSLS